MRTLEIPIGDLLSGQIIESVRLEFKKTWNDPIAAKVAQTICAFANDLQGRYGGYIVLGVEETQGKPILPPHGLDDLDIDKVQQRIRVLCKTRIAPEYVPILSPERYHERSLLVIWVPPGEQRPYKARISPSDDAPFAYFVRVGAETIEVKEKDPLHNQLMQQTTLTTFDQRKRHDVDISVISDSLLRRTLLDMGSDLISSDFVIDSSQILKKMGLSARTNGSESPRNVALLFFTDNPDAFLPGTFIEMAQFRDDGDIIETRSFRGPIQNQIRNVVDYLDGLIGTVVHKVPGNLQAERFVAFPHDAMREAIVNAVYHRGYDHPQIPIKIGLYPDRMEITSYPGPVPGLLREHLEQGATPPQLPARNPHVGDLLKRLRLAETWLTGIPKIRRRMRDNGSPLPKFDFDDARTYFRVTLPAHPGYVAVQGIREAAALWYTGDRIRAGNLANELHRRVPDSGAVAALRIDFAASEGDIVQARQILNECLASPNASDQSKAIAAMARALVSQADRTRIREERDALTGEARRLLSGIALPDEPTDAVERAILHKRSGDYQGAHRIFNAIASAIQNDPKALHEFAQTKNRIAATLRRTADRPAKKKLNQEAAMILRRVLSLSNDQPQRAAWAWFDLARTLQWLGEPSSEIRMAIEKAKALGSADPRLMKQIENSSWAVR